MYLDQFGSFVSMGWSVNGESALRVLLIFTRFCSDYQKYMELMLSGCGFMCCCSHRDRCSNSKSQCLVSLNQVLKDNTVFKWSYRGLGGRGFVVLGHFVSLEYLTSRYRVARQLNQSALRFQQVELVSCNNDLRWMVEKSGVKLMYKRILGWEKIKTRYVCLKQSECWFTEGLLPGRSGFINSMRWCWAQKSGVSVREYGHLIIGFGLCWMSVEGIRASDRQRVFLLEFLLCVLHGVWLLKVFGFFRIMEVHVLRVEGPLARFL